ncbi:hypothetical protein K504DRAFT_489866 [Pleomassaria siparia CBS 279.74]|uniref:Uncharacterized protein n=1 Tax=Pleomassaria siparia CBS 279.74 TaxID=1314801 RepID=A0A6G1KEH8_9PLEO|nr:hypothetical protein K504DRAFT_489866 [Pleomassaria siparia CBS 279.74]
MRLSRLQHTHSRTLARTHTHTHTLALVQTVPSLYPLTHSVLFHSVLLHCSTHSTALHAPLLYPLYCSTRSTALPLYHSTTLPLYHSTTLPLYHSTILPFSTALKPAPQIHGSTAPRQHPSYSLPIFGFPPPSVLTLYLPLP